MVNKLLPVHQVRETCAQALGALLTHLPGDLVEKVLDELLALCGHKEVCLARMSVMRFGMLAFWRGGGVHMMQSLVQK